MDHQGVDVDEAGLEQVVATRYTFYGTHTGDYQGFAPTGKPVAMTGTLISQVAAGKIVEEWLNVDFLGQRQQLGLIPT